ncbi:MAG: redox-regulated ATPase YchF [Planctomycetes bacterium]|jgi:GTP-binding protein YchF|nr:redox-regulated ATPase YchF [Planctomycetota bacterium]
MGFKCGIVGLPNVGKSTLFNAITASEQAAAANYPFCTIDKNTGTVVVPDPRIDELVKLVNPARVVPATIQFDDIAGLVEGASRNEGLGNKFLAHIRESDAIAHVVRCFDGGDIIHVTGSVDPERDVRIIQTELALKDLATVESRLEKAEKLARGGDKEEKIRVELLDQLRAVLNEARPAREVKVPPQYEPMVAELMLLTRKPVLYVCNVGESDLPDGNKHSQTVQRIAADEGAECVIISVKIEQEISRLSAAERREFLDGLGLKESGLDRLIRAGYRLLGLRTYFTAGPKEVRAWTIRAGDTAPVAAGKIHSDFEKGFIRAETISYADYIACGGEQGAKDKGRLRTEGKEYVVQDGDVMHFLFKN